MVREYCFLLLRPGIVVYSYQLFFLSFFVRPFGYTFFLIYRAFFVLCDSSCISSAETRGVGLGLFQIVMTAGASHCEGGAMRSAILFIVGGTTLLVVLGDSYTSCAFAELLSLGEACGSGSRSRKLFTFSVDSFSGFHGFLWPDFTFIIFSGMIG